MKKTQILAAVVLSFLGGSAAYAGDDLIAPQSGCGGAFSGFYAGGQLGFGSLQSDSSVAPLSFNDSHKGFTIGGTTGYNWQCDGRLWGIESDINYFNADTSSGLAGGGNSLSLGSEINWFGTLRGRVGILADENFLIFATGGLAYGGIDHSIGFTGPPVGAFSQSDTDTEIGWTVGGGIEYMIRENWSLRADALYVDFGSQDHTYTATSGGGCPCFLRADWDDNFWVTRIGLTYHFPRPEPVYAPLK